MNIEAPNIKTQKQTTKTTSNKQTQDSSVKFADELKELETAKDISKEKSEKDIPLETETETKIDIETMLEAKEETTPEIKPNKNTKIFNQNPNIEKENNVIDIKLNQSLEELTNTVQKLNQPEEKPSDSLKIKENNDDNKNNMINNDFNIQENKDILPQMNPNMNFSGDGQPFSSFMGNESKQSNEKLSASASDLEEETAVLSTMAENIAIANRNTLVQEKVVNREEGIKKVDTKTGITIENIVKYDSIIMNEADVEVFAELVNNGEVDLNKLTPETVQKSVKVSKTLADMLTKAKDSGQPLRIDFDNGISVIIKISKEGKVRADFLPSTQVAETYLKENLPLLRQRFDEKNIDYDALNQRERREQNKENNRKKGRRDE